MTHEFKREQWEMENYMAGEVREMEQIYVEKKGFSEEDAKAVMGIMSKYPQAFVEMMCVDELGFIAPNEAEDFPAWKKGLVTMLAFDAFGSVPISIYILAKALPEEPNANALFVASALATAVTMFVLGFTKASFTKQNRMHSGALMLANGSLAATAAYAIGAFLENFLDV